MIRYGQIYRGNKAKFAIDRKAAGVLIYIDPADTGTRLDSLRLPLLPIFTFIHLIYVLVSVLLTRLSLS